MIAVPNLKCNTFSDNFGSIVEDWTKMAESVEELLKCQICLKQIRRPKMLPCQHSFCKEPCLEIIAKSSQKFGSNLECFVCHKIHQIPNGGVGGFPDNLLLISLLRGSIIIFMKCSVPKLSGTDWEEIWSWQLLISPDYFHSYHFTLS